VASAKNSVLALSCSRCVHPCTEHLTAVAIIGNQAERWQQNAAGSGALWQCARPFPAHCPMPVSGQCQSVAITAACTSHSKQLAEQHDEQQTMRLPITSISASRVLLQSVAPRHTKLSPEHAHLCVAQPTAQARGKVAPTPRQVPAAV
jgi:hypothetical protein